jgi:hypothetical protein
MECLAHDRCVFEQLGEGILNLPKEERAKFTLAAVGPDIMQRLIAPWNPPRGFKQSLRWLLHPHSALTQNFRQQTLKRWGGFSLRWSHIDHMIANCLKLPSIGWWPGKGNDLSAYYRSSTSANRSAHETQSYAFD